MDKKKLELKRKKRKKEDNYFGHSNEKNDLTDIYDRYHLTKKQKDRRKLNKVLKILLIIVFLAVFAVLGHIGYQNYLKQLEIRNEKQQEQAKKELISEIKSHYNQYVITNKTADLFVLKDEKYEKIGKISKKVELSLEEKDISEKTKYFHLSNVDYYIKYQDVDKIKELTNEDTRFLSYIPFNENIVTKDKVNLYDKEDNAIFKINSSLSLPIIIKEDERFYVIYNNDLLYIKSDDVATTIEANNQNEEVASKIRTVTYHAFYKVGVETDCTSSICHPEEQIESHAKYLSENNFFTLNMKEVDLFIDGKINLPKNSIIITIDDGLLAQRGIDILGKYKLNATVFLVTAWFKPSDFKSNEYIEFHSHGDNLHNPGICPGGQGGAIKCLDKAKLLEDLKLSKEKLDNSTIFCYPFYEYNDYSISVLKDAGFTMAFAGYKNGAWVKVGTDKYQIPRYTVTNDESLEHFVSEITS